MSWPTISCLLRTISPFLKFSKLSRFSVRSLPSGAAFSSEEHRREPNHKIDGPRRLRSLEKKAARLEKQGTAKARTLGLLRAKVNDLKKDVPNVGKLIP